MKNTFLSLEVVSKAKTIFMNLFQEEYSDESFLLSLQKIFEENVYITEPINISLNKNETTAIVVPLAYKNDIEEETGNVYMSSISIVITKSDAFLSVGSSVSLIDSTDQISYNSISLREFKKIGKYFDFLY